MTLILAALTQECTVVVSDRRLTNARTGELFSDKENKAVVLNDELVFGYTGFAKLDGIATDEWIGNTVGGVSPDERLTTLARRAEEAVRKTRFRIPANRRLQAFLMAGWVPGERERTLPTGCIVSNFHDAQGQRLTHPTENFTVHEHTPPRGATKLISVGAVVSPELLTWGQRIITRYSRQNPGRPHLIAQVLVHIVRCTASTNGAVGRDMLLTTLPHSGVGSPMVMSVRGVVDLSARQLMAAYVGEDMYLKQYGPNFVHDAYSRRVMVDH